LDNRFWDNRFWGRSFSVKRLWRDLTGSVLVEYTVVFPLFIVVVLGTVDVSYMLYEWGLANKAAYMGARKAVVSNPVASAVSSPAYSSTQLLQLGQLCFDAATGVANANCPSQNYVCTPAATAGACTNGGAWAENAFTPILTEMQRVFPRLNRQNVQISYQTNTLGFVGRPGGLPLHVTVSIQCMTHQFFFIDALMGWIFTPPTGCPTAPAGPRIPTFASTLQSEDMTTN
jgi:Flp pilus assembly protein TadG